MAEIYVEFQKGSKGDLMARVDGKISFVDRRYKDLQVRACEIWEVEIVGENPKKTVYFLRPKRKIEETKVQTCTFNGSEVEIRYLQKGKSKWFWAEITADKKIDAERVAEVHVVAKEDPIWQTALKARVGYLNKVIAEMGLAAETEAAEAEALKSTAVKVIVDNEGGARLNIGDKEWNLELKDGWVRVTRSGGCDDGSWDRSDSPLRFFVGGSIDRIGGIWYKNLPFWVWSRAESCKVHELEKALKAQKERWIGIQEGASEVKKNLVQTAQKELDFLTDLLGKR